MEKRDKEMSIDSQEKRKKRQDLLELARPQSGVDDLKGKFSRPAQAIPGVVDKNASPATTGTMSAPDPTGKAAR